MSENDTDRLPRLLSPSRASDFKMCAKKFYFGSIERLRTPSTPEQLRGTLAHEALEMLFLHHPKGSRDVAKALSYIDPAWEKIRTGDDVAHIVAQGPEAEAEIVDYARRMVENYFAMENPNRFDPVGLEIRLMAEVAGAPLHGIIDRLDRVEMPSGEVRWYISDYKTGKVPRPDDRFLDEKFFAMKVYAAMALEMLGIEVYELRLIYLAGGNKQAILPMRVDDRLIRNTREQMKSLWRGIKNSARKGDWPTRKQTLCGWCDFQEICPEFHPELDGMEISDLVDVAGEAGVALALPKRREPAAA